MSHWRSSLLRRLGDRWLRSSTMAHEWQQTSCRISSTTAIKKAFFTTTYFLCSSLALTHMAQASQKISDQTDEKRLRRRAYLVTTETTFFSRKCLGSFGSLSLLHRPPFLESGNGVSVVCTVDGTTGSLMVLCLSCMLTLASRVLVEDSSWMFEILLEKVEIEAS